MKAIWSLFSLTKSSLKLSHSFLLLLISGLAITLFGHGNTLDVRFFYSYEEALILFSTLSEVESASYLRSLLFDFLFMAAYSACLYIVTAHLFKETAFKTLRFEFICLIAGIFDFFETVFSLLILLNLFSVPKFLPFLTSFKWSFILINALLILFGLFLNRRRLIEILRT